MKTKPTTKAKTKTKTKKEDALLKKWRAELMARTPDERDDIMMELLVTASSGRTTDEVDETRARRHREAVGRAAGAGPSARTKASRDSAMWGLYLSWVSSWLYCAPSQAPKPQVRT
jgi:hypothetical protein